GHRQQGTARGQARHPARHDRGGRPPAGRGHDEPVPVHARAAQREEHLPRRELARVDRRAGERVLAAAGETAPDRARELVEPPQALAPWAVPPKAGLAPAVPPPLRAPAEPGKAGLAPWAVPSARQARAVTRASSNGSRRSPISCSRSCPL